jgi:hypothetical protein
MEESHPQKKIHVLRAFLLRVWKRIRRFYKKDCCDIVLFLISLSALKTTASAQMDMNHMDMSNSGNEMSMTSAYSLSLPASRDGSGTSWSPDADPIAMYMIMKPKTQFMFHGNIFIRYTAQDVFNSGSRGNSKFDAPNWAMFMLNHKIGKFGLFNFTAHVSLDPITEGSRDTRSFFRPAKLIKVSRWLIASILMIFSVDSPLPIRNR